MNSEDRNYNHDID